MIPGLVLLDGDAAHLPKTCGMSVMVRLYERVEGSIGGWQGTRTGSTLTGLRLYLVRRGRAGMSAVGTTVSEPNGRISSRIDVWSAKRVRGRGREVDGMAGSGCGRRILLGKVSVGMEVRDLQGLGSCSLSSCRGHAFWVLGSKRH